MRDTINLADPKYTPVKLLNATLTLLKARSNFHLARILEVDPATIHRVYYRQSPISERLLVQIMDRTGWHITHVRELMGVPFDGARALVVMAQSTARRFPKNLIQGAEDGRKP